MGQDINLSEIKDRLDELEKRMNKMDTQYAVINTKLSAILWGVGTIGVALVGVLMKMLFGV